MNKYIDDWRCNRLAQDGALPDIRLIALDMDGTLLNEAGVLTQESKDVLLCAMERGVHVVIATGRVFSALPQDVVCVPGIEYAITSNGANIVRLSDQATVYSDLIDGEAIAQLVDLFYDSSIMKEVFFHHQVYAQRSCLEHLEEFGICSEKSKHYVLSTRIAVEDATQLLLDNRDCLENINLIFGDLKQRQAVWEHLKTVDGITVCSSMPYNLEIGGAHTSKAAALSHLAELLGVKREQILACGDSSNDVEMLRYAGVSAAMGNAEEIVKAQADMVTKTNAENGVAYAVSRLVLERK